MRFTDIFIRRPVLAFVVSALILLVGMRSLTTLPVRQFPLLTNTVVTVTTIYPGASAELMQGFITTPIEQAVASAEGIDYMTSSSVLGASTIQVYIRLNFDPEPALTEVMAKVKQVRYLMPPGANDPIITKSDRADHRGHVYRLLEPRRFGCPAISDYLTRVVQPMLSTVDGVASADILGGQTFAMRLWLDPVRMAGRGVAPTDVSAAIRANNFQAARRPAEGLLHRLQRHRQYRTCKASISSSEMVVKAKDGALRPARGHRDRRARAQSIDASVAFNGEHAIFIGVQATPQGNPLTMVSGVRAASSASIERNAAAVAEDEGGLRLRPSSSNPRSTRWTDAWRGRRHRRRGDLPVPGLVPLGADPGRDDSAVADRRLQPDAGVRASASTCLTLLAMVLAIGLVVDDAIVVVENIYRHIEEGKPPVAGRDDRRARNRRPRHRHDHHARRGLCADRLPRRPYRHRCSANSPSRLRRR